MEEIKKSLERYVKNRTATGSFLRAVLENDLFEAMNRADHINRRRVYEICVYIYNTLPIGCYGSKEVVENWLNNKN